MKPLNPTGEETDPRIAEMVRKDRPATLVHASVWHDFEGAAACDGELLYWLHENGNFLSSGRSVLWIQAGPGQDREMLYQQRVWIMRLRESWLLHTFARLNCHNITLQPRQAHQHHRPKRARGAAFTVWHEIVVTSVPKIRSGRGAEDGEKQEIRLHWVRGHYADYTRGAGLFGNPKLKAVFWIPEHQAGSEEAGEVQSTYRVNGLGAPRATGSAFETRGSGPSDTPRSHGPG